MKCHISATIDPELLERVDRYRRRVRRSRSQVIEIAMERLLSEVMQGGDELVVSDGAFEGSFKRHDTYQR